MKIRSFVLFASFIILAAAGAQAQSGRQFTFGATEHFDPFGILGTPVGSYLPSDATVACPGNEPTGDPTMPCPEGSRTLIRNRKWMSRVVSGTPDISDGWMTIVANSNLSPEFTGPQWGTFSLAYDSGGTFAGTWQGVRYKQEDVWVTLLHVTGKVTGGEFDGARGVATDLIVSYTPIPYVYTGVIEGRLVSLPQ